jgi:integrase
LQVKTKEELAFRIGEVKELIRKTNRIELSDSWEKYLKNPTRPNSGKATLAFYRSYWSKFINSLNVKYLDEITEKITHDYMGKVFAKVSGRTYNSTLQALKLVFRILSPDINPFDKLKSKPSLSISKKDFTEKQIKDIFDLFEEPDFDIMHKEEMHLLFMIGRWTGLRLKDCALMKWQDIDLKRELIQIKPYKTAGKKSIIIPIHKTLLSALNTKSSISGRKNRSEYVLPEVANRYNYNPSGVNKDCMFVISKAGIKSEISSDANRARAVCEYGFHSFRHSFVSFCAKAGVPMAIVQTIVGHGSPAMTRHYTHIGTETLRAAIRKL